MKGVLGLNAESPVTIEFLMHLTLGNHHLIPTKKEVSKQAIKFFVEYLVENDSENHERIFMALAAETTDEMEEWLRVQMFNLKQADIIKKEMKDG